MLVSDFKIATSKLSVFACAKHKKFIKEKTQQKNNRLDNIRSCLFIVE